MRFLQSRTVGAASTMRLISALRDRMIKTSPDGELSGEDEAAFARLVAHSETNGKEDDVYEFDRKFLFRVLVLGNAQLIQGIEKLANVLPARRRSCNQT